MKLKHFQKIGVFILLIGISACSKEGGQSTTGANPSPPSNQQATIALRNLYTLQLGNNGSWLIAEYENTGNSKISAFKGKWTVTDDLGDKLADQDVRYTSDTPFGSGADAKSQHVILPGEKIIIINQGIRSEFGSEEKVFATTKENIVQLTDQMYKNNLIAGKLDDLRVTKKFTFELEKAVAP